MSEHTLTAILPCNDLETSARFYARLGFRVVDRHEGYWLLADDRGAALHLRQAEKRTVVAKHNPFGVYLYVDDVDGLAANFPIGIIGRVETKPWGMYEFALSDPDGTLVRVGRRGPPVP